MEKQDLHSSFFSSPDSDFDAVMLAVWLPESQDQEVDDLNPGPLSSVAEDRPPDLPALPSRFTSCCYL